MLEHRRLTRQGVGQIVLLRAEAGLGKSNPVAAPAERAAADARAFELCPCSPRRPY